MPKSRNLSSSFALLLIIEVVFLSYAIASTKIEALKNLEPEEIYFFMEEKVVSASRFSQPASEAPSTVFVITEQTIQERGYRNLVDVLKDLPGFDIHEHIGGQAGGTYVIQRGIWGNNKLLVLKDGTRINPENGSNLVYGNQISIRDLKKIEIMYGPSSAIYGADAFSGIINLITKDVQRNREVEMEISGGNANTVDGYLRFGIRPIKDSYFQFYGHAYSSSNFNLRDIYDNYHYHHPTLGTIPFYNPDEPFEIPERDMDLTIKAGYKNFHFEAMYFHTRQPTNIAAPYTTGRTQTSKDKVKLDTWNLVLRHEVRFSNSLSLKSKLHGQLYRMDPKSRYGRKDFNNYIYERSDSFGLEEQVSYNYKKGCIIGGFEFKSVSTMPYLNSRTPFDEGDTYQYFPIKMIKNLEGAWINIPPVTEQNYWTYGIFLQTTHNFTEKISLFAGARFDWETFTHHKSFNPRIGLIYKLRPSETIKLMYGHAYISPSAYFLYKAWADKNYAHLPPFALGKTLDPEKVDSLELSYTKHGRRLFFSISGYFLQSHDIIHEAGSFYTIPGVFSDLKEKKLVVEIPTNSGQQTNFGIDINSKYKIFPEITIYLNYSFINARTRLHGHSYDSPKISNHKIMAGITGYLGKHLSYNFRCRWRSEIHTQPSNAVYRGGTIPGIFQVDANLRWLQLLPGLDLEFTAKNLLNSKYFLAANESGDPTNGASLPRVPQDPFSFLIGIKYKFF